MCLAIRGKIIELNENAGMRMAKVDFGGVTREACVEYLLEADAGDYVMVHAGMAISKVDEAEAVGTYKYPDEQMDQLAELIAAEREQNEDEIRERRDQLHQENLALKEEIDHASMCEN